MDTLDVAVQAIESGLAAQANPSTNGSRQGLLVDWRTPQANEAGARVETLYTKDGQPARPGERAYRKTPDGRLVLQSQTINQQVEMVSRPESWATPRNMTGGTCRNGIEHSDLNSQAGGKLNPRWVETLMGLPVGWTMPSCACPMTIAPMNCGSSAMELFPPQQNEPSLP